MNSEAGRVHVITLLITLIGATCCVFQAVAPFRGAFQFLTVQVTFVAGAVTYARAVRWILDPEQRAKARLILRGNWVALASVAVTLGLDCIAQYQRARLGGVAMGVAALTVLTIAAAIALPLTFRGVALPAPPPDLGIAEGIDDLLTLVRWIAPLSSDGVFNALGQLNPRRHPWDFAWALGAAAGLAFFLMHLQEGLPPNVGTGLLIAAIFVGIESVATLAGFVALGPYLGLRNRD